MFKNRQFEFEYLYWKAGFFQSFPYWWMKENGKKMESGKIIIIIRILLLSLYKQKECKRKNDINLAILIFDWLANSFIFRCSSASSSPSVMNEWWDQILFILFDSLHFVFVLKLLQYRTAFQSEKMLKESKKLII